MADKKISDFTNLTAVTAGDLFEVETSGGNSRKVDAKLFGAAFGSSFPGSPASGDRFYRTDRNIEYVYDGTRWLSTQMFTDTTNLNAVSATTNALMAVPWIDSYDVWLVGWSYFKRRSAAGEWDLTLSSGVTAGTLTTIDTVDGSGDATGDFLGATRSIGALLDSSATFIQLAATEISGTAVFYVSISLHYRLVG